MLKCIVRVHAYGARCSQTQPWRAGEPAAGTGSGFFVRDNYVLTCAHVVEGAQHVSVVLPLQSRDEVPARVVRLVPSAASSYDLALLEVALTPEAAAGVGSLPLGDSDALVPTQDKVLAVGFSLGLEGVGWSEGTYATLQNGRLQHSASISGGNSGGPLLNARHQVVGVNSSGAFGDTANNINWAVPIELYKRVAARMLAGPQLPGPATVLRLPTFGFCYEGTTPVQSLLNTASTGILTGGGGGSSGVRVTAVLSTGPAAQAGLRVGDVVEAFLEDAAEAVVDHTGQVAVPWHVQRVDLSQLLQRCTDPGHAYGFRLRRGVVLRFAPADVARHGLAARLPPLDPLRYVGFAGLVCQELCANFFEEPELAPRLAALAADAEARAQPCVVITAVLRGGDPTLARNLKPGQVLAKVNRRPVASLAEVRKALLLPLADASGAPAVELEARGGSVYAARVEDALAADEHMPYKLEANVRQALQGMVHKKK